MISCRQLSQAASQRAEPMTTLKGSNLGAPDQPGVDMAAWDLAPLQGGQITRASGNSVTIDVGDHHYVLNGRDFVYVVQSGHFTLVGGTITGLGYYPDLSDGPPTAIALPEYTLS